MGTQLPPRDGATPGEPVVARFNPAIKKIERHDERPRFSKVLTAPGAALAASEEQRKVLAVLDLGAKMVCIVWTNLWDDRANFVWAKSQCERHGYRISEIMEAPRSIIEMFYSAATPDKLAGATAYRGRSDELFDEILVSALEDGASDIHWQIEEGVTNVYFRIDGQMVFYRSLTRDGGEQLSRAAFTFTDEQSRSGVAAFNEKETLSASMTREVEVPTGKISADGHVQKEPTRVKLRWESHPIYPDGWDITQRVLRLGQDSRKLSLEDLGYNPAQVKTLVQAYRARVGLILMVGATGSGKSTTLSTCAAGLLQYHDNRKKLITIEDPTEYIIKGARQISVTNKTDKNGIPIGVTFIGALKTAMRSDPDFLLMGEIRDAETAVLTQHCVDTGHLVLSTVHAKSPLGSIGRLLELGMSPSVISDEGFIRLVVYQALIPKLCEACKVPWSQAREHVDAVSREQVEHQFAGVLGNVFTQKRDGCPRCKHTGVRGRTVVAEMLVPDREMRSLIPLFQTEGSNARLLAQSYWRGGLSKVATEVQGKTCMDQAIEKVSEGLCCPLNVQMELGLFSEQSDPAAERAYYLRHSAAGPEEREVRVA